MKKKFLNPPFFQKTIYKFSHLTPRVWRRKMRKIKHFTIQLPICINIRNITLRSTRCPYIVCLAYSTTDFRQHAFHFFLFKIIQIVHIHGSNTPRGYLLIMMQILYCNNSLNLLCSTKENGRSCSIIIIDIISCTTL